VSTSIEWGTIVGNDHRIRSSEGSSASEGIIRLITLGIRLITLITLSLQGTASGRRATSPQAELGLGGEQRLVLRHGGTGSGETSANTTDGTQGKV